MMTDNGLKEYERLKMRAIRHVKRGMTPREFLKHFKVSEQRYLKATARRKASKHITNVFRWAIMTNIAWSMANAQRRREITQRMPLLD